jgi:hypothetical protein
VTGRAVLVVQLEVLQAGAAFEYQRQRKTRNPHPHELEQARRLAAASIGRIAVAPDVRERAAGFAGRDRLVNGETHTGPNACKECQAKPSGAQQPSTACHR